MVVVMAAAAAVAMTGGGGSAAVAVVADRVKHLFRALDTSRSSAPVLEYVWDVV